MACRALLFTGKYTLLLNRTYSLKRHKEFRFTYRTGRQVGGGSFVLVTARNRKGKVQVGFSVSKKIGNSVQRNRAKRRLKACFSPLLPRVKPGYNLIFIARSSSLTAPFLSMQRSMVAALQRAGVYEEPAVLEAVQP